MPFPANCMLEVVVVDRNYILAGSFFLSQSTDHYVFLLFDSNASVSSMPVVCMTACCE